MYRDTARDFLERDFAGTRVVLTNNSDGVLRGRLDGIWDQRSGVKSSAADCGCVRWTHSGGLFELKPFENLSLLISHGKHGEGGISGDYHASNGTISPFQITVDGRGPTENLEHVLDGDSWRQTRPLPDSPEDRGVSIRIWSTGPPLDSTNGNTLDHEALSQLQALGYLQ